MNIGKGRIILFEIFTCLVFNWHVVDSLLELPVLNAVNVEITLTILEEYKSMIDECRNNNSKAWKKAADNRKTIFDLESKCIEAAAKNSNEKGIIRVLVSLLMKYWTLKYSIIFRWGSTQLINLRKKEKDEQQEEADKVHSLELAKYLKEFGLGIKLEPLVNALKKKTSQNEKIKVFETNFKILEKTEFVGDKPDKNFYESIRPLDLFFGGMLYEKLRDLEYEKWINYESGSFTNMISSTKIRTLPDPTTNIQQNRVETIIKSVEWQKVDDRLSKISETKKGKESVNPENVDLKKDDIEEVDTSSITNLKRDSTKRVLSFEIPEADDGPVFRLKLNRK